MTNRPFRFASICVISGLLLLAISSFAALTISNGPATNITRTSAYVVGTLSSTNATNATVILYYGTSDATTNAASWATSNYYGNIGTQSVSTNITGLTPAQYYYYRWYAVEGSSNDWANATSNFWSLAGAPTSAPPAHTYHPVMVDTNGDLAAPTNFFLTNTQLLDDAGVTMDTEWVASNAYLQAQITSNDVDISYLYTSNSAQQTWIDGLFTSNTAQGLLISYLSTSNAAQQVEIDNLTTSNAAQQVEIDTLETGKVAVTDAAFLAAVTNINNWIPSNTFAIVRSGRNYSFYYPTNNSFFTNDAAYVTATITNGLPDYFYREDEVDALVAARVPTSRTVTAGNRLSGGGALSGNITLHHETNSPAYSGYSGEGDQVLQTILLDAYGHMTGGVGYVIGDTHYTENEVDTLLAAKVDTNATVTAGNRLSGGGALSGNITINHDTNAAGWSSYAGEGQQVLQKLYADDYGHITNASGIDLAPVFYAVAGDTLEGAMNGGGQTINNLASLTATNATIVSKLGVATNAPAWNLHIDTNNPSADDVVVGVTKTVGGTVTDLWKVDEDGDTFRAGNEIGTGAYFERLLDGLTYMRVTTNASGATIGTHVIVTNALDSTAHAFSLWNQSGDEDAYIRGDGYGYFYQGIGGFGWDHNNAGIRISHSKGVFWNDQPNVHLTGNGGIVYIGKNGTGSIRTQIRLSPWGVDTLYCTTNATGTTTYGRVGINTNDNAYSFAVSPGTTPGLLDPFCVYTNLAGGKAFWVEKEGPVYVGQNLCIMANASAPAAATNVASFYALADGGTNTEMWVKDGLGNATQLSSHVGDMPVHRSYNEITGRCYFKNLWTGEETKTWIKPTLTWEQLQQNTFDQTVLKAWRDAMARHEKAMRAYVATVAARTEYDAKTPEDKEAIDPADVPPIPGAAPPAPGPKPVLVMPPRPKWVADGLKANPKAAEAMPK